VFGLNVGPTPVELSWSNGALAFAWMDQLRPDFRIPPGGEDAIYRAIGLTRENAGVSGLPVEEISCGTNYIFVPLATRSDVDAAEPDVARMKMLTSAFPGNRIALFVFSTEPVEPGITAYSRMFAPDFGIVEDPATGGASGPLGAYLVKHGLAPKGAVAEMISLQGVRMKRPSRISIRITSDGPNAITRVQVGGTAVRVAAGDLELA
jgi:trans-2,3-dihydro-3-hydroxyanthranilate isomerase